MASTYDFDAVSCAKACLPQTGMEGRGVEILDQRIEVIAYSGYRGEETPKTMILGNTKIEVVEILNRWVEEGLEDRARKRVFKVKGSDGGLYQIYHDEEVMGWFHRIIK